MDFWSHYSLSGSSNSHQFWDYSSLDALGDVNRKHYVAMDSVSYAADLTEPLLTFGSIKKYAELGINSLYLQSTH